MDSRGVQSSAAAAAAAAAAFYRGGAGASSGAGQAAMQAPKAPVGSQQMRMPSQPYYPDAQSRAFSDAPAVAGYAQPVMQQQQQQQQQRVPERDPFFYSSPQSPSGRSASSNSSHASVCLSPRCLEGRITC